VNIGTNGSNGVVSFQNLRVNQAITNAVLAARVIGAQLTPTNGIPNCVLWLDSADSSTLVITNGYITTWLDKSGTTNNGTASSTSLVYSHNAGIPSFAWGGQNLVTFSNNGQFNVNLSSLVSNTYSILSIEVNDNLPGKSYAQYFVNTTYEGVDGTLGFGYQTGNSFRLQQYADDTTYTLASGVPYFTNVAPQPRIWSAINDVTNSNGNDDEWLYYNGAPVAGGGGHHYLDSVIGAHIGGGNCYQGLAEIAIYNTNLTDVQRSNVENYFVTKWEQNSMAASVPFVVYPSNPSVSIIGPAGASTNGNAASSVTVDLSGIPGKSYRLQATTNLTSTNWMNIGTNTGGVNGAIQFIDTGATNYPDRYYRAVSP
jgi:hypothetical protein